MNSIHLRDTTESYVFNIDSLVNTAKVVVNLQNCLLNSRSLLIKVFNFIEANYRDSISLRDVAEAVDRSPAYLTDLMRRETGKTVLAWIIECRMAEARRLLLETSQSVEQVSEAVGYFDRRHFSRLFLRFHGTTPQTWRREHQSSSISFLPIDPRKVKPVKLIKQRATTMTDTETQRLQVCMQEIAAILYKDTTHSKALS
jgi:AraC-like DNA-binding protein